MHKLQTTTILSILHKINLPYHLQFLLIFSFNYYQKYNMFKVLVVYSLLLTQQKVIRVKLKMLHGCFLLACEDDGDPGAG